MTTKTTTKPASTPTPQSILQDISQIHRLERGTLNIIREGPDGPYYNHQCYENGKNVSRYVPRDQVADIKEAIESHRRLQQLVDQYIEVMIQKTRSQRLAGAKKKPPLRNCSSPKTPKSSS